MATQQMYQLGNAQSNASKNEQVVYEDKYLVTALRPQHSHEEVGNISFLNDVLPIAIIYLLLLVLVFLYGGFSSL